MSDQKNTTTTEDLVLPVLSVKDNVVSIDNVKDLTDPRVPVLVQSFNDLVKVREDGRKDKKPGVIAHSTRTMDRIVKGISTLIPGTDVSTMESILNDGRGQTSKNKVLNDLLSDLGV